MVKWSLDGPLSELYPTTRIVNINTLMVFRKPKKKEPCPPKKMAAIAKNIRFAKINLKIISSEIAGPVGPKLL
jgi:hypothetical protein